MIVDRLQKRFGWRVSAEAILHLPGVIPGFNLACRSAAAPGDGLLLQTPMYPPILRAPDNCGLTREEAPLGREADGRYAIDFDVFRSAIRERTRLFLLCNPHNPVGRVWDADGSVAHRRDLPRAESRDRAPTRSTATSSTPGTSTCRSPRSPPRSSAARSR